jgi:glycosyltransferase involved in cell wall biosynthesis
MKVAIVHDALRTYGDAERLLVVLHRLYPEAPLYTAFVDESGLGTAATQFNNWEIRTTGAQRLPAIVRRSQTVRPLLPYFWETLDLSAYDLVISSAAEFLSHAVLTRAETLHVCYCHTPSRTLWEPSRSKARSSWYEVWADSRLRQYDVTAAQRVDRFITNSVGVARRIRKVYRRSAEVIPPPVKIQGDGQAGDQYYLYVGDLQPQRQVEMAVAACSRLDRPLWVVGTGDAETGLRQSAGQTIRFLGRVSESELPAIYASAKALIVPQTDADFSFSAVEAMGFGVPVIAYEHCGIHEIVLNYRTGLLFAEATIESLCSTILQFEGLRFFSHACIQRAAEFAEAVFTAKLEWFIAQAWDAHRAKEAEEESSGI